MLALAIVITVLILLALLRFGLITVYDEAGFHMWVKVGFLKFNVQEEQKAQIRKKQKEVDIKKMMPGSLSEFMDVLRAVGNTLRRLKRRLLIKRLIIHYTAASDDPAAAAILFGTANAVFGTIIPILERNFRIKRRDLSASADFDAKEQSIYARIDISIALWEVVYAAFALLPVFTAMFSGNKSNTKAQRAQQKDINALAN